MNKAPKMLLRFCLSAAAALFAANAFWFMAQKNTSPEDIAFDAHMAGITEQLSKLEEITAVPAVKNRLTRLNRVIEHLDMIRANYEFDRDSDSKQLKLVSEKLFAQGVDELRLFLPLLQQPLEQEANRMGELIADLFIDHSAPLLKRRVSDWKPKLAKVDFLLEGYNRARAAVTSVNLYLNKITGRPEHLYALASENEILAAVREVLTVKCCPDKTREEIIEAWREIRRLHQTK